MTALEFKAARQTLNLNQSEFAQALGYASFVAISRKETGTAAITNADKIIIGFLLQPVGTVGIVRKKKPEKVS